MKEDKLLKLMKRVNLPDNKTSRRYIQKVLEDDDDTQVYTKPWVSLTDDEIWGAVNRIGTSNSDVNPYVILKDARAIEAKLKEKNT